MPAISRFLSHIFHVWLLSFKAWKHIFFQVSIPAVIFILWTALPFFLIPGLNTHYYTHIIAIIILHPISFIVYLVVSFWCYGMIYYGANLALENKFNFFTAAKEGLKRIIFLVPAAVGASLLTSLGYILFLLPGIFLSVLVIFYLPLIVIEDLNPVAAAKKIFLLMKNQWWQSAWTIGVPIIFYIYIMFLLKHFIVGFDVFSAAPNLTLQTWYFHHMIHMIFSFIYLPFFVTVVLTQLRSLKMKFQMTPVVT